MTDSPIGKGERERKKRGEKEEEEEERVAVTLRKLNFKRVNDCLCSLYSHFITSFVNDCLFGL